MDISIFFRFITQQNDSFLRTLDVIIGQFFIKIVVYYRIRKLRTAVEHIPPDDSRSLPFSNPKTFNKILLCLCLGNLAQERKLFQILCLTSKKHPDLTCHQLNPVCIRFLHFLRRTGCMKQPFSIQLVRP